ncbi:amidase domain-containing protein [Paenibacillus sp. NPDC056933]|uniref:amidase domain-containing protein n=1 Tax=Paenibacillus sp. NPDC056933 TaxID=3345968 RepID=UPI0036412411
MYKWITMLLVCCLFLEIPHSRPVEASSTITEQEIKTNLEDIFLQRSKYLAEQQHDMDRYYDLKSTLSRHAYTMEVNRKTYLHAWAEHRNMKIIDSNSKIHISRILIRDQTATVSLGHSQQITYAYKDQLSEPHSFGLGTWHAATLKKVNGQWIVWKEWYLDPLEENPHRISEGLPLSPPHRPELKDGKRYKRKQAVAYANKYAGMAGGTNDKVRYNAKYKNYNNLGGDCTNFASQALGDPTEGGRLPMRGPWRYHFPKGGTRTWVQTDALKNFLLYSGYGKTIAKDSFSKLVAKTATHPYGAIGELEAGDLIAHVMNNDVDHFSIVTGFDQRGYPLVNSHTADRFQAPFDLGWDNKTTYILIHIQD